VRRKRLGCLGRRNIAGFRINGLRTLRRHHVSNDLCSTRRFLPPNTRPASTTHGSDRNVRLDFPSSMRNIRQFYLLIHPATKIQGFHHSARAAVSGAGTSSLRKRQHWDQAINLCCRRAIGCQVAAGQPCARQYYSSPATPTGTVQDCHPEIATRVVYDR